MSVQAEILQGFPLRDIVAKRNFFENELVYDGIRQLIFQNEGEEKIVPVFDLRNETHHSQIAMQYADYKTGVVFGIGLYGVAASVEFPTVNNHPDSAKAFWNVKPDRSSLDKIPLQIHPKDLMGIMDFDMVHPEFRKYLDSREKREQFYKAGVAMHLVVPVKKDFPYLDPIFVTQPEDWRKKGVPQDLWMDHPTAAAFWWDDPDQERIYLETQRINPHAYAGISSFNDHGEMPAWDEKGVLEYLEQKGRCPFDFMVGDSKLEQMDVKSSHPQIAVPLKGGEPIWKVYRTGATDIKEFMNRLGSSHQYRIVEKAPQAKRAHPEDMNLDPLVMRAHEAVILDWQRRHPPKHGVSRMKTLFS